MSTSVGHVLTVTGEPDKVHVLHAALQTAASPDSAVTVLLRYEPKVTFEETSLEIIFHARDHDCVGLVEALAARYPDLTIVLDVHDEASYLKYETMTLRGATVVKPWSTVRGVQVEIELAGTPGARERLSYDLISGEAILPLADGIDAYALVRKHAVITNDIRDGHLFWVWWGPPTENLAALRAIAEAHPDVTFTGKLYDGQQVVHLDLSR